MFGDADAVRARSVDDENAAGAGGRDVDVVDAGARASDDPDLRRRFEEFFVHLRRAADEQRVGVRQIGGKNVTSAPGPGVDRPSGLDPQQLQRGRWKVVGDDDFQ